jgi:two-component system, chemotaxis family, sensor kinase CheA
MDDLLPDFVAECRDMLEALGGEIVAWETDPGDVARLDSIFRFVHTVKGNCGFFDFPRLEALSHAAEGALADVRAGRRQADAPLVSAVLAVIDRIGEMVLAIERAEPFPDGGDDMLIDALDSDTSELLSAPTMLTTSTEGSIRQPAPQRTIRLSVELLDRVMNGVSDMVLARNDLARHLRESNSALAVDASFGRLSAIIAEMREAITRTRMQRIESLFVGLPRLVRDVSAELGKQVLIDIQGGDVELDREMIELIRDPLTHIIRNAIDHGLETPKERQRTGKREIGLLTVSAHQSGNQILIVFTDDGRGIDDVGLTEKAVAAGIIDAAQAARLSKRERFDLMFRPGLSTSDEVTSISGRGVGMDVVRSNIERIGGVVDIDSSPGEGTRLTLRVPLTLTIISALTVSNGGQQFAIPRSNVEELVMVSDQAIEIAKIGDATLTMIRGRRLPSLSLTKVLGQDAAEAVGQTLVVLRMAGGDLFTLAVDRVHDHEELVIKPAAPAVMAAGVYAGTTLAADGSPILLLDVAGLAQAGGLRFDQVAQLEIEEDVAGPAKPKRQLLLFSGLNGHCQAMPLAVIDRILELDASCIQFSAGQMRAVIDEEILPLIGLADAAVHEGKVNLFRLHDGNCHVCYAIGAAIEMRTIEEDITPAESFGEIEGLVLIDGEQTELIDPHWIFARHSSATAPAKPPVCLLPSSDNWIQNLLRPLVEAAGYMVVDETADITADLAILSSDETEPAQARTNAAQTIWLRDELDELPGKQGSIYRYDRHGLMTALKKASLGRG